MTRITLDAETRTKLLELRVPLELCDETGEVLARVIPQRDNSSLEPQIPREEIERRKQHRSKGYSTAEVLAHLESL